MEPHISLRQASSRGEFVGIAWEIDARLNTESARERRYFTESITTGVMSRSALRKRGSDSHDAIVYYSSKAEAFGRQQ